jgi:hypothetical protein
MMRTCQLSSRKGAGRIMQAVHRTSAKILQFSAWYVEAGRGAQDRPGENADVVLNCQGVGRIHGSLWLVVSSNDDQTLLESTYEPTLWKTEQRCPDDRCWAGMAPRGVGGTRKQSTSSNFKLQDERGRKAHKRGGFRRDKGWWTMLKGS